MSQNRWDPEMRAARQRMDAEAARLPPITLAEPFDASRAVNAQLAMLWGSGGPTMAESSDRWLEVRGRRIFCRLHRPRTDRKLPVLIWMHGGGWVFQTVDTHDRLTREYAAAADIAIVSIDYALSPEARFPTAILECAGVVHALADTDWGLDTNRIVLGGDSAGGNLALATALKLREDGVALRGILALYPITDADFTTPSYREFAEGHGLTQAAMRAYWNLYVRDPVDCLNPLASPLRADCAGLPPTLFQLAELDVLRSDGEAMAARMRAAGVDVTQELYDGVLHGFARLLDGVTKSRTALANAATWLRRVTA